MKMLYVYGEDHSASDFEKKYNAETIYNDMVTNEVKHIILENNKESYIEVKRYEFESVDPYFVEFVIDNIADYDESKHSNFYIVQW